MYITENDMINAVIKQLDTLYPDIPIYKEKMEQSFVEPSFSIRLLEPSQTRLLNNRYTRHYNFDIHYFTSTNDERITIANSLYLLLEYLSINDKTIRASKLDYEISNEELHFFANYNVMILKEQQDIPDMQNLEYEEGIKDE